MHHLKMLLSVSKHFFIRFINLVTIFLITIFKNGGFHGDQEQRSY